MSIDEAVVEERGLDNTRGILAWIVPVFELKTIQHADEITTERRTNLALRDFVFYTADYAMYELEGDDAVLYLGRVDTNPIFGNLEESTTQLSRNGNYRPSEAEAEAVREADTTLKVKLADLELWGRIHDFCSFEIDTAHWSNLLNDSQRKVAERVYGSMEEKEDEGGTYSEFGRNMRMIRRGATRRFNIYVLDESYVKTHTKKGPVVRAALLMSHFRQGSSFSAEVSDVKQEYTLRGVLRRGWCA